MLHSVRSTQGVGFPDKGLLERWKQKLKDVDVRIDMPFNRLLFNGGLKQKAFHQGRSHGHDIYGIRQYSDLNSFLGEGWHMRALNERLDFCYVNLGTVKFYLHE